MPTSNVSGSIAVAKVQTTSASVNINVSAVIETLQFGASANYNPDGDIVESNVYIVDTTSDVFHPELLKTATATLYYKGSINLGSVSFDRLNGTQDGTFKLFFSKPQYDQDLTINIQATLDSMSAQNVTIPVLVEHKLDNSVPLPENKHGRLTTFAPRTEVNSSDVQTQPLQEAPYTKLIVNSETVTELLNLDFTDQYGYANVITGQVTYFGGGNRLLPVLNEIDQFYLQDVDTLPVELGTRTFVEPAATNYQRYSSFNTLTNSVPRQFTLVYDSTKTIIRSTQISLLTGIASAFSMHITGRGQPFTGQNTVEFKQEAYEPFTRTLDYTFSILAKVTMGDSLTKSLKFSVNYKDAFGVDLTPVTLDYDPAAIGDSSFVMLSITIPANSAPASATQSQWKLQLVSIDGSDDVTLTLALPQIEHGLQATSRIPTDGMTLSRTFDDLFVQQSGNFNNDQGSVIITFAPGYDGIPTAEAYLFDTRDTSNNNGYAAKHLANGKIVFYVAGPSGTVSALNTTAVHSFGAGSVHTIGFGWRANLLQIQIDGGTIETSTAGFFTPTVQNDKVHLLSNASGSTFGGEIQSVQINQNVLT